MAGHVFKSTFKTVKTQERQGPKEIAQGLGAAFALCLFSVLFCTVILMRFP